MKKKSSLKAEDILIEENISKSTFPENYENVEVINKNKIWIASHIYSFLTSDQSNFPENEKEQIKNQIKASIRRFIWKSQLVRISAAASILVICAFAGIWYSQMNSSSEIVNYAQTLRVPIIDNDTKLILQNGQEIRIGNEESQISYTPNGKNITIGTDQKVVQDITIQKPSYNTVIVPYGKRTFITLSDGTKVWLNSGSKLIYPAVFSENKREVYIDGEAVFDVTHSVTNPFYVQTRNFEVKVLGTIFNVSAYADDKNSSTVLEKGKIELSYKENAFLTKEKFIILPGTRAVFDPDINDFTKEKVNSQDYMSWKNGYLIFSREKLINILKKLTRYYNVEIILQNAHMQNETFSGSLDLKNSPTEVLDIIAQTTPFNYKNENNKIVIIPK